MTDVKHEHVIEEEVVITSCGVLGFNMDINKVIDIKSIGGTKRLPERLSFKLENGRKHIWPVETILTLDNKTLVTVYNRISKYEVVGRQMASDVQRRICKIREEKAPH